MAVAFTAKCGLKTNGKQMGKQSYAAESRIMHAAETMEGPVISSSTDWPKEPKLYADVVVVVGGVYWSALKSNCHQNDGGFFSAYFFLFST